MTSQDDLLPVGLEDALPARARTITSAMRAVLDAMDALSLRRRGLLRCGT